MNLKHLSLLAVLLALFALMVACASPTPAPAPTNAPAAPAKETVVVQQTVVVPQTVVVAPTAAPVAAEPTTITFWHTYGEGGNSAQTKVLQEQLIPAFQKAHPDIKVVAQNVVQDAFHQKLITAIGGGTAPDVARVDIAWITELANIGALAQLDTEMSDFADLKSKVYPGPLSTNAWQGHYYGLPLDTNTRIWMWNKQVYDKAGISAPPKTLDELTADCAKIKAAANVPCFADGGTYGWAVMPWIWSFGGDITDPQMTKATGYINSKETVAAYTFLKDMLDKGYLDKGILGGGLDTAGGFATDKIGSLLEGPWMPGIYATQYPNKQINWALMPAGKAGSISVVGGEDIAVFQQSKNKKAATEFVRFMLSPEAQLALSKAGQVPVRPDVTDAAVKEMPYYQLFLEQLKTSKARLPHANWSKIESILTDAGQIILRGEKTPQQALDDAAAKIDPLLK